MRSLINISFYSGFRLDENHFHSLKIPYSVAYYIDQGINGQFLICNDSIWEIFKNTAGPG